MWLVCFSTLLAHPAVLPTPICDPPAPAPAATEPGMGLGLVSNLRIMSAALPPARLGSVPGGPKGTAPGWDWPSCVAPGCVALGLLGLKGLPGTPGNAGTGDCGIPRGPGGCPVTC